MWLHRRRTGSRGAGVLPGDEGGSSRTVRTTQRARTRQRRRTIADRLTAALAVALVVVAVVTVLPASSQQRITALGCRVATVGLTDCVARLYTPPVVDLRAMPVCEADDVLEQMVPTVERQRLRFPEGGELERWAGRDGTIRVVPRDPGATSEVPPSLVGTDPWPQVRLLGDVALPRGGQWVFPGGVGEKQFVADLQQVYADEFQSRSAVSLFTGRPDTAPPSLSPQVSTAVLPRNQVEGVPEPMSAATLLPGQVAPADGDVLLLQDRASGTTYTTVPVHGTARDGAPVSGVLRWGREASGRLSEVLVSVAWADASGGSQVVHLYLPLREGDDQEAETWLTSSGGVLDLAFLSASSVPPRNGTERLVAAAGTVVLEVRDQDPEDLTRILTEQFAQDRRVFGDLVTARSDVRVVRPQPSGGERTPVEITC